ncbi:MAG: hypothetical protein B6D64_03480 [Bacteroidetes bacterium 4484_276]|nr:MAG: hypothetical protein B6D64_03480 [Bacteroidetes bacterium 4484_276]
MNQICRKTLVLLFLIVPLLQIIAAQNNIDSLRFALQKDTKNPTILNDLATALIPDSISEGRKFALNALAIAKNTENPEEQARALYTIGDSWWYEQDYATAIGWFGKSATCWEKVGNQLEAAACYNEMGYSCVEIDRFDEALRYFKKSLQLLLEINDEENLAAVITNIGRVYYGISKYDSAIFFNEQAIALSDIPGREDELVTSLGNLGLVYKTMGDYEKALEYYTRAYEISKKMNFLLHTAIDLNNIAAVYLAWEKYEIAAGYFWQALEIDKQLDDLAHTEMTLSNLASAIQSLGYPDSALAMFQESLAISEKLGRYGNSAIKKINIGTLYYEAGQYQEALQYFIAATETAKQLGLRHVTAGGLQNVGATYSALGNFKEAETCLDEALATATEIGVLSIVSETHETRSILYERMGKPQQALEAYRNYSTIKDSLFTEKSQAKLAEMEARYETEKKQQQIEILLKDNQIHETDLKRKQTALIGLSAGLLILLIASSVITLLFVQKSRANRKLVEKNLELMRQDDEESKPVKTGLRPTAIKDDKIEGIINALDRLMKRDRVFSQAQLSLSDLAEMLETNTSYLSKAINENFNSNFSTYLNNFRVREAQKMFANQQHKSMTLEGIARSVGFHSRSSFNTAFRKFSGVTPTVFIKNLHEITKTKNFENTLQNS